MAAPHRDAAESRLRAGIARGDLPPGYRLIESALVESYGTTRSSIRLAIETLITEGLVERVPNRSARVRVVSRQEAVAIAECRMVLESLLARRAAERITDEEITVLRTQVGQMARALAEGDLAGYSTLIATLHATIRAAARQPTATELVDRLAAQIVRHQFQLSLRPGRAPRSFAELGEVVEAVTARDPDRADAAARRHFRAVIDALRGGD
ncbi:GntR family transcriptional regulator [Actinomycetospora sp. TBRC 11914]|nr:GntR family transcriptional regulator [Actinomycetospora sp. TBRC 11914]